MEPKKSSKANLNDKRGTFFVLGVILGLSILFVGLEYSSKESDSFLDDYFLDELAQDFELLPSTDEDQELAPTTSLEQKTVFTENIKETTEVPSEMDNTLTPLIDGEITEENTEKEEETSPTPPLEPEQANKTDNLRIVEQMPEFPGGLAEYTKWLTKNLRYPDIARNQKIQGKVVVQFIVNKDGTIADAKVVKSVNPHLDREAMRVIRLMPSWKPGIQNNQPCKTMVAVPIVFKL
jgi:protein TonB